MSSGHTFAGHRQALPLQVFLEYGHEIYLSDPARYLGPLVDGLEALHQTGRAHGSVLPGRILVAKDGVIDTDFFISSSGGGDQVEMSFYYPWGRGGTPAEAMEQDIRALAAVLHLVIADQPPARPARRRLPLSDHPAAAEWPAGLVSVIDQLLAGEGTEEPLPGLADISRALACQAGRKSPDPAPRPEDPAAITGDLATSGLPDCSLPVEEPAREPENQAAPLQEMESCDEVMTGETSPAPADVPEPPAPVSFRLPNGMVGRSFSFPLDSIPGFDSAGFSSLELVEPGVPGLGLAEGRLEGTPAAAGEYMLELRCHLADRPGPAPSALDRTLILTVNPDPQSLWKNTPSDPSVAFWKPDTAVAVLEEGPLAVLGASLRGRSHAHVGSCRDDDMAVAWHPASGWYVLAVADGAGSAKYSREGSRLVCQEVQAHFAACFGGESAPVLTELAGALHGDDMVAPRVRGELYQQFGTAALRARKAVEDLAASQQLAARDFHTTLIAVIARPLEDGQWFLAAFSVGDGAAAVTGVPGSGSCLLTTPDGGEFAGQTVFLTMKEALATGEAIMERISFRIVPSFEALLLVTDGISDPRFESGDAMDSAGGWASLWEEIRTAAGSTAVRETAASRVLEWMGFHSPGHHDDRTVVIAAHPSAFSPS